MLLLRPLALDRIFQFLQTRGMVPGHAGHDEVQVLRVVLVLDLLARDEEEQVYKTVKLFKLNELHLLVAYHFQQRLERLLLQWRFDCRKEYLLEAFNLQFLAVVVVLAHQELDLDLLPEHVERKVGEAFIVHLLDHQGHSREELGFSCCQRLDGPCVGREEGTQVAFHLQQVVDLVQLALEVAFFDQQLLLVGHLLPKLRQVLRIFQPWVVLQVPLVVESFVFVFVFGDLGTLADQVSLRHVSAIAHSLQKHVLLVEKVDLLLFFSGGVFATVGDKSPGVNPRALFVHVLEVLHAALLVQAASRCHSVRVDSVDELLFQVVVDGAFFFILLHLVEVPLDVDILQLVQTPLVKAFIAPQVFVLPFLLLD